MDPHNLVVVALHSAFHEEDPSVTLESVSSSSGVGNSNSKNAKLDRTNRKATIVIEHIIQASDVAHTVSWMVVLQRVNL